jgi:hypothetical protein
VQQHEQMIGNFALGTISVDGRQYDSDIVILPMRQ